MSIDISCYATSTPSETENILTDIISKHGDLFTHAMTLPKVRPATPVHIEIAAEHGFNAASFFLISVKDKLQASRVAELANALREAFNDGEDSKKRILVLRDNEKSI